MATATYKRPWLAPYQTNALFTAHRYAVIEATTKAGKTVGAMVWLTEQAMAGKDGQNYWWVAPTLPIAKIVFRRLKKALPRGVFDAHETDVKITLANGAVIWFKGADKPDSLYGEDVYAAVIDEASRCKEDAWHAVRSTLTATNGPIRIIGNVRGRKNWAYQLARTAESGAPNMHYAKITAHDAVKAGIISQAELEDAQRLLPEHVFKELYLAEPSDDGGNPFGLSRIESCLLPGVTVDGTLIEWATEAEPVVWGWDLAKSSDYTVGIGLDATGTACRVRRYQKPWEDTIEDILKSTGDKPALVDSTGVGDPVLEALQKRGRDAGARYTGFKFTPTSKQQLMEGLAVAIGERAIRYPDGAIRSELDQFEFVYTRTGVSYSAPIGQHDDCVCGLALARAQFVALRPGLQWVNGTPQELSPEEVEAEKERIRLASAKDVSDAVMTSGGFFPGGF